jgi:hypothetical protein
MHQLPSQHKRHAHQVMLTSPPGLDVDEHRLQGNSSGNLLLSKPPVKSKLTPSAEGADVAAAHGRAVAVVMSSCLA